jgi:drug/metabolite transporter (DMT)-like permease
MRPRDTRAFLLLCLIWGTTWIGVKAGLEQIPPLFFAGSRFTVAGLLLLALQMLRGGWRVERRDLPRLAAAGLLMVVFCYASLFWGMVYIDSGTAAVLEMGLTPIALLGFALGMGEERLSARRGLSILLGLAGLLLLFGATAWRTWTQAGDDMVMRLLGAAAVASAAITYGSGSVIARPLLRRYPSAFIAGATTLVGGVVLLLASFLLEPGAPTALRLDWGAQAWAGWLFLVLFGSLVGYSLYMRLLRDIGPSRAGMFAFVSPLIAVALGALLRGERIGAAEAGGMAVLLIAAWMAIREPAPDSADTAQEATG